MSTPIRPAARTGPPDAQPGRLARLAQAADRTGLRVLSTVTAVLLGLLLILAAAPASDRGDASAETFAVLAGAAWIVAGVTLVYGLTWLPRSPDRAWEQFASGCRWGGLGLLFAWSMALTSSDGPASGGWVMGLRVALAITGTVALVTWMGRVFAPDQERVPE